MSYLWADMWLWKGLFHSADESSPSERRVERWVPKSSSKHVVEKRKGQTWERVGHHNSSGEAQSLGIDKDTVLPQFSAWSGDRMIIGC